MPNPLILCPQWTSFTPLVLSIADPDGQTVVARNIVESFGHTTIAGVTLSAQTLYIDFDQIIFSAVPFPMEFELFDGLDTTIISLSI